MDHELKGNATLVLAKRVKLAPGALLKLNWNAPLPSRVTPVSSGGVGLKDEPRHGEDGQDN